MAHSKPHFLLIHGAYHRAWHLHLLQKELEKAGYQASSIDLPAGGQDAPTTGGLAADTDAIRALIEEAAATTECLIPVFHSYSGIPGSDAVAEVKPETAKKIEHIIYLGAFVIPAGRGLTTPFGGNIADWAVVSEDGKWATVVDLFSPFYHDLESELAKEAASHIVPYSKSAFDDPTKHCGWKLFPKTYVSCSEDQCVTKELTQMMFDEMAEEDRSKWAFETIEGSHSPFLSKPETCARLILKIAGQPVP